jgi:hypothetical protein
LELVRHCELLYVESLVHIVFLQKDKWGSVLIMSSEQSWCHSIVSYLPMLPPFSQKPQRRIIDWPETRASCRIHNTSFNWLSYCTQYVVSCLSFFIEKQTLKDSHLKNIIMERICSLFFLSIRVSISSQG